MKKNLLLLTAILALSANAFGKEIVAAPVVVQEPVVVEVQPEPIPETPKWILAPRVGVDAWSEYTDQDSDGTGYEAGLELLREVQPNLYLGIGAAYQVFAEGEYGAEYKSVPVYGTVKYRFWKNGDLGLYAKGNLGYAFNFDSEDLDDDFGSLSTNVHDGMYWAAGLGTEYRNFFMDVMYQQTQATSDLDDDQYNTDRDDNNYDRVTVGFGYNFAF